MKWAIISDICGGGGDIYINWGDYIQVSAIRNLYKNIGIEMQSVIRIPYQDLKSYSGEPVILPVNIYVNWLPLPSGALFSDSIYPVFLGVSFPYEIDDHLATWLKHWEPIGCRDEDTYRRVVTKGIDAYIAGCLTITLPERKKDTSRNQIYAIDPPKSLYFAMPPEIKNRCIVYSNIFYGRLEELGTTPQNYADKLYLDLCNKAKLVISSRLHVVVPCMAMGIPVCCCVDEVDYRYPWIERFISIYTKDDFSQIDWDSAGEYIVPASVKEAVLHVAENRLWSAYYKYSNITIQNYLTDIYRSNSTSKVVTLNSRLEYRIMKFIKKQNNLSSFQYTLWGITPHTEVAYKIIQNNIPKSRLVGIYDTYKRGIFLNLAIQHPENIAECDLNTYHIVCGYSPIADARILFHKLNIPSENILYLDEYDVRVNNFWNNNKN